MNMDYTRMEYKKLNNLLWPKHPNRRNNSCSSQFWHRGEGVSNNILIALVGRGLAKVVMNNSKNNSKTIICSEKILDN